MISSPLVTVSATFDSGTFMHFGISASKLDGYNSNIQSIYNLDKKDFQALEMLINIAVSDYLKGVQ